MLCVEMCFAASNAWQMDALSGCFLTVGLSFADAARMNGALQTLGSYIKSLADEKPIPPVVLKRLYLTIDEIKKMAIDWNSVTFCGPRTFAQMH